MSCRPTVLIASTFFKEALEVLQKKCNVIICENTKESILEKVRNVDAIYWSTSHTLDRQVVDTAGSKLKAISTVFAGYDNVDVELLKSKGIKFGNTSDALKDCVAEVAVSLALIAAHRMQEGYNKLIKGQWSSSNPQWLFGQQLCDSVVGIVGLGHIGTEIAVRIKSFKVKKLLYTGNSEKPQGKELGAKFVSLDELLEKSDFVVVACSLNESTRHLFNKAQFNKMKSNAIIINISRGDVINQEDLVDVLRNKTIGGAALDVMTPEPLPQDHPLTKLENCVLSPHIGSDTYKTTCAMHVRAAENILAALEGRPMPSPVL